MDAESPNALSVKPALSPWETSYIWILFCGLTDLGKTRKEGLDALYGDMIRL